MMPWTRHEDLLPGRTSANRMAIPVGDARVGSEIARFKWPCPYLARRLHIRIVGNLEDFPMARTSQASASALFVAVSLTLHAREARTAAHVDASTYGMQTPRLRDWHAREVRREMTTLQVSIDRCDARDININASRLTNEKYQYLTFPSRINNRTLEHDPEKEKMLSNAERVPFRSPTASPRASAS
ncbi:uncharacterized protein K489DRAFT_257805 [Dissoconium aciculare CBS 342.82]|uniref:Uncharacterized protein n=1 Tax=Dissoconium aciculare CBS 342.82 TaxID=1314786 RepID=A0A6J3M1R5_9PEZI|nr:uncharacterized protein K489DRAFT_257805 [Dissoconium aciculare CBS 342.82]KAF1821843.1 hypothetical protein K489DRAFT_257805 [Dissoconium aciculare CBS 342.82]